MITEILIPVVVSLVTISIVWFFSQSYKKWTEVRISLARLEKIAIENIKHADHNLDFTEGWIQAVNIGGVYRENPEKLSLYSLSNLNSGSLRLINFLFKRRLDMESVNNQLFFVYENYLKQMDLIHFEAKLQSCDDDNKLKILNNLSTDYSQQYLPLLRVMSGKFISLKKDEIQSLKEIGYEIEVSNCSVHSLINRILTMSSRIFCWRSEKSIQKKVDISIEDELSTKGI